MSTRQRATLDAAAEPIAGGTRLLPAGAGGDAAIPDDLAAVRLRALAARLADTNIATLAADKEKPLGEADAEFEPVSLATIVALGRDPTPDTPGDSLIAPSEGRAAIAPPAAHDGAPSVAPPVTDEAAATPVVSALLAPPQLLQLADETSAAPVTHGEALQEPQLIGTPRASEGEREAAIVERPVADQPLMLADQSGPEIRLIDLIRRQQTLLEQLNRFPPPYGAPEDGAGPEPAPADPQPLSVIDQLAPPPALIAAHAQDMDRAAPPPLPPPEHMVPTTPAPKPSLARARKDEPPEPALPEQSPIIIQRARAERTGRRMGPDVGAPPSALPAFLVGLGAAAVIAGILFVVL